MAKAVQIRRGNVIKHRDQLWRVTETQQTFTGKRSAYFQMRLRNLADGHVETERFNTDAAVEKAFLETRRMQYLYQDGDSYVFMEANSGDQVNLSNDMLEDALPYLCYNAEVDVQFHEGQAVSIEMPTSVVLEVTMTEPAVRGDTATGVTKPATLETGLVVRVPGHVKIGDRLHISTSTGEFQGRA